MLKGKKIILGVSGSIAAYKSAYLVRELIRGGALVRVVMSESAAQFIAPLTLSTLSGNEVLVNMWPPSTGESTDLGVRHVDLGLWGDVMVIAPASAHTLGKIAHGLADNALTSIVLSLRSPLIVAPAMDLDMYRHPAVQKNIGILLGRGCTVVEPEVGELASGLSGPGRLPEIQPIIEAIEGVLKGVVRDLSGEKILVTAGPTREAIDPVRYIGNRSSGKMGFAVATAAARRGAEVILITGPTHLETPLGVTRIDVESAAEMMDSVNRYLSRCSAVIMAAAVADFTPTEFSMQKIKKSESETINQLKLSRTKDILQFIGERKNGKLLIGFAAETENEIENGLKKLKEKSLDYIVVNNPLTPGAEFGGDTNKISLLGREGFRRDFDVMSKFEAANKILDLITEKN